MLSTSRKSKGPRADQIGIWASALCAVHCAISPLLIVLAPAFAAWWVAGSVHIAAAVVVIPLALLALYAGWLKHACKWPLICAGVASLLIILGLSPFASALTPLHLTWGTVPEGINQFDMAVVCCPTLNVSGSGGSLVLPWVTMLTLFGSLLLIIAHAGNISLLKRKAQST